MIDLGEYIMHPRNLTEKHDLSDPIKVHITSAEAQCRRGMKSHPSLPTIKDLIEFNYIENKTLEKQFEVRYWNIWNIQYNIQKGYIFNLQEKKIDFSSAGSDDTEVLLFHATGPANTHNICSGNFDLSVGSRFAYGRGIYFSKCPNVCLQYGQDLILCRVLLGRAQPSDVLVAERRTLAKVHTYYSR
jgi:hypothetical protein